MPFRSSFRSVSTAQRLRLGEADDEVVQVAAHLESIRPFEPADPYRLKPGRSDEALDLLARTVVIGCVEQDRVPG
jgi:hypothetical protein